jgi:hypothetical protein
MHTFHLPILAGKPEGKKLFRSPRYNRKNNIKTDVKKTGCGLNKGWTRFQLVQEELQWRALVITIM